MEQDWADMNAYAEAKTGVITEIKERARRSRPQPHFRIRGELKRIPQRGRGFGPVAVTSRWGTQSST